VLDFQEFTRVLPVQRGGERQLTLVNKVMQRFICRGMAGPKVARRPQAKEAAEKHRMCRPAADYSAGTPKGFLAMRLSA
jgi:hypothetical protein